MRSKEEMLLLLYLQREPSGEDLQALCRVFPCAEYLGDGSLVVSILLNALDGQTQAVLHEWQTSSDILTYDVLLPDGQRPREEERMRRHDND